jgi:type II secretory ATPase GspE/PulE/Tfp pilus assembly ATPase PilB-like protein
MSVPSHSKAVLTFGKLTSGKTEPSVGSLDGAADDRKAVISSKNELQDYLGSPIEKVWHELVENVVNKVCPVQLADKSWAILSIQGYQTSDIVDAVVELCVKAGAKVDEIRLVTVTQTVILAINSHKDDDVVEWTSDDDASGHLSAFTEIIRYGVERSASDVHLNVEEGELYSQICYTIEGQFTAPPSWKIETSRLLELINVAWQKSKGGGAAVFSKNTEQQCNLIIHVENERIMCRWASLAADRGVSVALRILKMDQRVKRRSLESQGFLPSQIAMFVRAQNAEGGAIVIAGVVNSGKSTTLAELLSMIPPSRKVLTLEDPVEYLIPRAFQSTVVRSLDGDDDQAFTSKLKTFKRSAGNDILLGEIRDTQTGSAFVDITGSGTNLYCTLHAKSVVQIPERLASEAIAIPYDFLASPGILNLLVYQALVPVLCPHCRLPISKLAHEGGYDRRGYYHDAAYWQDYIKRLVRLFDLDPSSLRVKNDVGCENCQSDDLPQLNGYISRTVVASMLEPQVDRGILRFIRNKDTLSLQEYAERLPRSHVSDPDMTNKSIMESALYKALRGELDPRDIEQKTMDFDTYERIRKKMVEEQEVMEQRPVLYPNALPSVTSQIVAVEQA